MLKTTLEAVIIKLAESKPENIKGLLNEFFNSTEIVLPKKSSHYKITQSGRNYHTTCKLTNYILSKVNYNLRIRHKFVDRTRITDSEFEFITNIDRVTVYNVFEISSILGKMRGYEDKNLEAYCLEELEEALEEASFSSEYYYELADIAIGMLVYAGEDSLLPFPTPRFRPVYHNSVIARTLASIAKYRTDGTFMSNKEAVRICNKYCVESFGDIITMSENLLNASNEQLIRLAGHMAFSSYITEDTIYNFRAMYQNEKPLTPMQKVDTYGVEIQSEDVVVGFFKNLFGFSERDDVTPQMSMWEETFKRAVDERFLKITSYPPLTKDGKELIRLAKSKQLTILDYKELNILLDQVEKEKNEEADYELSYFLQWYYENLLRVRRGEININVVLVRAYSYFN